jgi:hypothetical protein
MTRVHRIRVRAPGRLLAATLSAVVAFRHPAARSNTSTAVDAAPARDGNSRPAREGTVEPAGVRALFISEATVKTHRVHTCGKLGVDSRTGAVTAALTVV